MCCVHQVDTKRIKAPARKAEKKSSEFQKLLSVCKCIREGGNSMLLVGITVV